MIVVGGWPGRNVVGLNGRFGVRPAAFAASGEFDNPFLNDVDSGDETTEFVAVVTALPASGTVVFDDDGGFEHTGAADGTYTTVFDLFTWAQGGPVTAHTPEETITTTFGSTTTAAGVVLVAAASLIAGSASGVQEGTASGALLVAEASLLAGEASGVEAGTAPGVLLPVAASLEAGTASGVQEGTASGVVLSVDTALIAGTASGPSGGAASAEEVWESFALEAGLTPGAVLRIVMAAVAGRTEGVGTDTERYFSVDGSKPRLTVTFDARSNRTIILLDGTP